MFQIAVKETYEGAPPPRNYRTRTSRTLGGKEIELLRLDGWTLGGERIELLRLDGWTLGGEEIELLCLDG